MSERTVTKNKSIEHTLNGKRVLLNYKWVFNYNKERNEVGNLNNDSTARSIVTLEVKRDFPAITKHWTQEDTEGVKQWEKLNESDARTPGGQLLAFEDEQGRKFIILTETFNGSDGSAQTTFDKKYFNSLENEELTRSNFDPDAIENWDGVHYNLARHKNGEQKCFG